MFNHHSRMDVSSVNATLTGKVKDRTANGSKQQRREKSVVSVAINQETITNAGADLAHIIANETSS